MILIILLHKTSSDFTFEDLKTEIFTGNETQKWNYEDVVGHGVILLTTGQKFLIIMIFEVSSAHQGCIYLIKYTVKRVILWNIIAIKKKSIHSCDAKLNFQHHMKQHNCFQHWKQ